MDQSDLDLLQTAPAYHLQSVLKVRHIPLSPVAPNGSTSGSLSPSPSSLPPVTLELAQRFFDVATIRTVLQDLNTEELAIIHELAACGGRANSRDLALYFSYTGLLNSASKTEPHPAPLRTSLAALPAQPPQYPPAHPHGPFEQALRHLIASGLVFWGKQTNFAGREYTSGTHDGVLIVPHIIRTLLQQDELLTTRQPAIIPDDASLDEGMQALQRTLYLYWSLVSSQREGLPLVNNGMLSRSALRQVAEHLGVKSSPRNDLHHEPELIRVESDAPRLLFLRLLLMNLGLLQERRGAIYTAPADAFFALPLLERAQRCYHLYVDTPFWNELLFLPEVNVRPGPAPMDPAPAEVVHSRQLVLERLLQETPQTPHDLTAFIARTKLYHPYLLFPRQFGPRAERYSSASNIYGWDFRLRRGWLTHREGWHMVEGGFIRAMVAGPLQWLGIVHFDQEDSLASFHLSPALALLMSNTPPETPTPSWGRLIVQPNFELVVLAPVSEALMIKLDRFAERVSLEHVAQYRLTRASVTRAIQRGLHADTIQAALEHAAAGEIPQNVRYSLLEWERQARRVEIWQRATLLEVDDAALLDALFDQPETRSLFGRRLSEKLVEVAPYQLHVVQHLLWQRNYLPALTNVAQADAMAENSQSTHEPQWRLHTDGLLQPLYAVLDLYLVAEIGRFTQPAETAGWYHLTAASVHLALEQGMALTYIQRFLQLYCQGGIPASLLIRLKLWGGGYADQPQIQVERSPLLRLSFAVLRDLQADEDLQPLLGTELEQESRLVRVPAQHLARVLELLRERGFPGELL